ncbi:MAG: phosphoribosylglycinamide formyltransferase [Fimbriimonadaceae bacterium]|nr:phosphoribosylglycinamide formyltransferase [Fimbriimonadaceae bacterium]
MPELPRVAILVGRKGRGTNMARLLTACASGYVPAEGRLVVAPVSGNPAAIRARALGARVEVLDPRSSGYSARLLDLFREERIDWVCLAGFMSLFPSEIVGEYEGRILNIHPALLPRFGGKGMYGIRVHEAVLAAGVTETGCTVHFVTNEYDEGEAILTRSCPVLAGDTPDSLADRVLELEHEAYPEALRMVVLGL